MGMNTAVKSPAKRPRFTGRRRRKAAAKVVTKPGRALIVMPAGIVIRSSDVAHALD